MIRSLSQMFVGAFFAVLVGSAAAQMYGGGYLQDVADTKAVPTQAGGDTTPPPAPAEAKSATKSKASKSHGASKSSSHAHVKSASHKKSASHATTTHAASAHPAKSTNKSSRANAEPPVAPEENAYRQALRGCATQPDQAQRDSCIDSAIEKYQRNT